MSECRPNSMAFAYNFMIRPAAKIAAISLRHATVAAAGVCRQTSGIRYAKDRYAALVIDLDAFES